MRIRSAPLPVGPTTLLAALFLLLAACGASTTADGAAADSPTESDSAAADSPTETESAANRAGEASAEPPATENDSAPAAATTPTQEPEATEPVAIPANGGVITVDGVHYVFETERCRIDVNEITNDGFGVAADGTPFTAGISHTGIGDAAVATAEITVGQERMGGRIPEDLPWFSVDSITDPNLQVTVEGALISGSGTGSDRNAPLATRAPITMTFDGQCQ